MLIENSTVQAIFSKIDAKTLEHPGTCSVLGARYYPRTGMGGGGAVPISDLIRLAGMVCITVVV